MKKLRALAALALLVANGCATVPQWGAPGDFGQAPTQYQRIVRVYFAEQLKDPESVQYREITAPHQGNLAHWLGLVNGGARTNYGWLVDATVNAKNSYGGYVGFRTYTFLFRGESIVDVLTPDEQ